MGNKYRLKFSKEDKMRFIGHLDLLKLFQRSIKRAGLPIAYSNGFNPHQQMSFALPLSLGYASKGEYVDIELDHFVEPSEIMDKLNGALPMGIAILGCRALQNGEKTSASVVAIGLYEIQFPNEENLAKAIKEVLEAKEIIVTKKSKSKLKEVDIRPDIFSLELVDNKPNVIRTSISSGSAQNLKPELLVSYLYQLMEEEYNPFEIQYCRMDLFQLLEDKAVSLF